MALGRNMKVDRLIPKKKSDESIHSEKELTHNDSEMDLSFLNEPTIVSEEIQQSLIEAPVELAISDEENLSSEPLSISTVQVSEDSAPQLPENIEIDELKVIFSPSRRKTQKRIIVSIEGSLTIHYIELLKKSIDPIYQMFDFVEVNLNNITKIDITAIQLFNLMRVLYHPLNKFTSINAEFSREDRKMLNTCGFTEFQTQVKANV